MELQGLLFENSWKKSIPSTLIQRLNSLSMEAVGMDFLGERLQKLPKSPDYIGLCPFHKEKTPSFKIRLGRGRNCYFCFGCHSSGGPLQFIFKFTEEMSDAYAQLNEYLLKYFGGALPPLPKSYSDPFDYLLRKTGFNKNDPTHQIYLREALNCEEASCYHHDYKDLYRNLEKIFAGLIPVRWDVGQRYFTEL